MDLWTFHRFQQPCLCVDEIDQDSSSPILKLKSGQQTYHLAFDDHDAVAQIQAELSTLRDSDAPLWTTLRESPEDSGWHALGTFLDTHSLIREARDVATENLSAQARRIEACIEGTVAAALEDISPTRRMVAAAHAATLRRKLNEIAFTAGSFDADEDPFDAAAQPNFFLGLLAVEFEYFRRFSPLTLTAVDSLLARIAGDNDNGVDLAASTGLSEACGLYDLQDLESHLWLVGSCIVLSTAEDAARFATPKFPALSLSSGLEFMRQTEILTRDALVNWGQNPYVTALDALNDSYSPLVAGPFIEQYHVTRRFVEIVAPLLSRRLSAPLRKMMFRYFSEEVGHEALESTTCEALGVAPAALDKAIPLPLHFAFVDALTLVADADPIASFAAIMVIEGIFGEPPKMSLRLAAVARTNPAFREISGDHDELNETLNHNSISRDAFEHITAVSPAVQLRVMRRILFLLELNHRAWNGIAEFYGKQNDLWLQGSFGKKLAPQG
jgi:hypothetical protein